MNRKLILSAALSGLMLTATAQTTVAPAIPRDGKIEKKVEALLKKMTLEEKIGQMTELTIDVITKRDTPGCCPIQREVGRNHPEDTGQIDESHGYSLYLWCRPDTWNNLYIGWNFLPPGHQYGSYLQPRTGA